MTALRAVVLGILQGLGEFLPISSSGHLIVVPWLMGWPDSGLDFDVALHLGTLAAVAFAFWRDWARMIGAGLRGLVAGKPLAVPDARLLWYVGGIGASRDGKHDLPDLQTGRNCGRAGSCPVCEREDKPDCESCTRTHLSCTW